MKMTRQHFERIVMKMTRQHFQFIADQLRATKPATPRLDTPRQQIGEYYHWLRTVGQFGAALQQTNPNFDLARFEEACGCGVGD